MTALPASTDFTGGTVTQGQFKTAISNLRGFLSGLFGTTGTQATALSALGAPLNGVLAKTGAYTVVEADRGKLIDATTGTWTLTFTAAATLADGFVVGVRNSGSGVITLDPNGSELIDGAATVSLAAGESCMVVCNGTALRTVSKTVTAASIATAAEVLTGTDNAKMVTALAAQALAIISGTAQATTSGTAINFASIPAGTKRITVSLAGVSTSGTSKTLIQLGDAGGFEDSGYLGCNSQGAISDGFTVIGAPGAGTVVHGQMVLTLLDSATNTWACQSMFGLSDSASLHYMGGSKALSAELTQIRLTTSGGANTFDAGLMNILYER